MLKFTPVFLFLSLSLAHAREIDRTAVLVNGDVILRSDLRAFGKNFQLRREIDPFVSLMGLGGPGAKEKEILDYLVQERMVLQKFAPTDEEIEEEVNAVQRNNRIDRDHLKEVLKSQGVKFEDYRRLMGVSVSKRKLIDKDLRLLAAISDEDVKNYYYTDSVYSARRKQQKLVLSYTLQQMLLPSSNVTETAQKRLKGGEDFDSVAAELAGRGVESSRLGTISEENMNPKIKDAIQGLRVGESTKAVSAGSGYMILRILEIGAPKDPVFEKERERIRNELFQKALVSQLKLWTEREKASSYIHFSN
ncbi:MAG TPA: peptidyl-prolyl cis-trans isomerase [Bdellovibrionota bacterium]|jgi:peptidyl-prolyl cis-trans isomerase SurA